jgi:acyl-CoA thioesterase
MAVILSPSMTQPFLDLRPTHNPHRWFLPLHEGLCVGPPGRSFMFGGVGLAASIRAMEGALGRPVIWATAQYLSYARTPAVVDFDVFVSAHGRHTSQARVSARVGEQEVINALAALGERQSPYSGQWSSAPDVPPPEACDPSHRWDDRENDLHSRMDVRVALGRHGASEAGEGEMSEDGRLVLWLRARNDEPVDSAMLAIMADHVPSGIGNALGLNAGANSLDNTIRFRRVVPTDWVLADIQIHAVEAGFVHGALKLYARSGELMATASQSMILRVRGAPEDVSSEPVAVTAA